MKTSTPQPACPRILLVLSLLLSATCVVAKSPNDSEALRKACQYLWNQQADDGGWHSPQYAVMRSGQALTPIVLDTLLQVPASVCPRPPRGVERALAFIRKNVDQQGALGHADPDIIEYPVYSTAYAILCVKRIQSDPQLRLEENDRLIARMDTFLIRAQFDENDGFSPKHNAYGGWGFDAALQPAQPGHMDLAHTRRALEAIRFSVGDTATHVESSSDRSAVYERARAFLKVVQKHPDAARQQPQYTEDKQSGAWPSIFDGGFYFSPVVLSANKGREDVKYGTGFFRSYATATCDGILALLAAGVPRDDERVVRAIEWLKTHDDLNYPQGVPTDHPEPWGEAVRFYHYAVRGETYAAVNLPGDWRARLAAAVAKHQFADGSFRNSASPLMKEDDPILCTTLATTAISHCREPQKDKLTHP